MLPKLDSANAIVVLSGMLAINEIGNLTYIEWGDPDKFFGEIALYKAGKAQRRVLTGAKAICYFKYYSLRKKI